MLQIIVQGRGGQGVRAHKLHADRGKVITGLLVADDDQVFLINDGGVVIRTAVESISVQGRGATGVRVMNLDDDTRVAAVARVLGGEDDEGPDAAIDGDETVVGDAVDLDGADAGSTDAD